MKKQSRDLRIKIRTKIACTYYEMGNYDYARLSWRKAVCLIKSRPLVEVIGMEIDMGLR